MSTALKLSLITLALLLSSCVGHTSCPQTEVKRVLSPDRKLVIIIYDVNCHHGFFHSYAVLEDQWDWFSWPRHPVSCTLETAGASAQRLEARWLDNKHIEVSSPDEVENSGRPAPTFGTCNDITVAYKFKDKPAPNQEAPDQQTVAAIHEAINQTESCIRQGGSGYADYLRNLVDDREHLQALELLCTFLVKAKCPISKETYDLLEQACTRMGIATTYLADLKVLVR